MTSKYWSRLTCPCSQEFGGRERELLMLKTQLLCTPMPKSNLRDKKLGSTSGGFGEELLDNVSRVETQDLNLISGNLEEFL